MFTDPAELPHLRLCTFRPEYKVLALREIFRSPQTQQEPDSKALSFSYHTSMSQETILPLNESPKHPGQTSKMPHFQSPEPVSQPDSFFSDLTAPSQAQTRSQSQERAQKIRVKNRRKLYLDRHPSYFSSPDLELADPLLYDRCIRRFQTTSEREADGRAKGYSGVLEADMYRTEAKIAAMNPESQTASPSSSRSRPPNDDPAGFVPFVSYSRGSHGEVLPEEDDEVPSTKEEGLERWKFGMTVRFLKGDDDDFDYAAVDGSDELDDVERREREESWFEGEEPEFVEEAEKSGETGVQDF
ncbi:hypothetical protein VTL71DRAFT_6638 [Oculimacula yallundae]|uniref:CCD97-like C-terminal domain-containing protein n=1 Tax=Oculimacula yallundae TaxID=86028 RepID=A0ABR4BYG1_9HELO